MARLNREGVWRLLDKQVEEEYRKGKRGIAHAYRKL